jgi:hypothetical protein
MKRKLVMFCAMIATHAHLGPYELRDALDWISDDGYRINRKREFNLIIGYCAERSSPYMIQGSYPVYCYTESFIIEEVYQRLSGEFREKWSLGAFKDLFQRFRYVDTFVRFEGWEETHPKIIRFMAKMFAAAMGKDIKEEECLEGAMDDCRENVRILRDYMYEKCYEYKDDKINAGDFLYSNFFILLRQMAGYLNDRDDVDEFHNAVYALVRDEPEIRDVYFKKESAPSLYERALGHRNDGLGYFRKALNVLSFYQKLEKGGCRYHATHSNTMFMAGEEEDVLLCLICNLLYDPCTRRYSLEHVNVSGSLKSFLENCLPVLSDGELRQRWREVMADYPHGHMDFKTVCRTLRKMFELMGDEYDIDLVLKLGGPEPDDMGLMVLRRILSRISGKVVRVSDGVRNELSHSLVGEASGLLEIKIFGECNVTLAMNFGDRNVIMVSDLTCIGNPMPKDLECEDLAGFLIDRHGRYWLYLNTRIYSAGYPGEAGTFPIDRSNYMMELLENSEHDHRHFLLSCVCFATGKYAFLFFDSMTVGKNSCLLELYKGLFRRYATMSKSPLYPLCFLLVEMDERLAEYGHMLDEQPKMSVEELFYTVASNGYINMLKHLLHRHGRSAIWSEHRNEIIKAIVTSGRKDMLQYIDDCFLKCPQSFHPDACLEAKNIARALECSLEIDDQELSRRFFDKAFHDGLMSDEHVLLTRFEKSLGMAALLVDVINDEGMSEDKRMKATSWLVAMSFEQDLCSSMAAINGRHLKCRAATCYLALYLVRGGSARNVPFAVKALLEENAPLSPGLHAGLVHYLRKSESVDRYLISKTLQYLDDMEYEGLVYGEELVEGRISHTG